MQKHLIKQILLEQKQEIGQILKGKIIKRNLPKDTEEMFRTDLIKVITGVRRCGKSVLSHQLLKDEKYGYINFDDERFIGAEPSDLNDFLEILKEIDPDFRNLFLDEAQNIKGWELFVNRLKRNGYNVIVSGSNSKLLSKELATHLTGRHFAMELYPFSFKEFLLYKDFFAKEEDLYITEKRASLKRFLEEYLQSGAFPEVLRIDSKSNYLRELFDKIITRDIISRYNIRYSKDLKELALYAISNFGAKISYHKVKNIFDIKSIHTVKNYLAYLEEAYILFQLHAFSFKFKQVIKMPRKVYCIDTGLINALVPKSTVDSGKLIENLVFLELKRQNKEIYFYSQQDYEVDFLIRDDLKITHLIQVSYSLENADTKKRETRALIKASEKLKCKNLTIITWDTEGEEKINSHCIKLIPLWKWLTQP